MNLTPVQINTDEFYHILRKRGDREIGSNLDFSTSREICVGNYGASIENLVPQCFLSCHLPG